MEMYDGGKLFQEKEWHDSYIFDLVRKKLEIREKIENFDISKIDLFNLKTDDHIFISSVLGKYMDHKKGNRKQTKWSHELLYRIKKEKENNS